MSAADSTTESFKKSGNRRIVAIVVVIVLALAFLTYAVAQFTSPPSLPTANLPQSGPISTFPASWGIYSGCQGFNTHGNTTTLGLGQITYPNSWNTTTKVTLTQVYDAIIGSSAFENAASGHGWVVYSWVSNEGGSGNMPPYSNDIISYFIFTNGVSPNGYVTAYYDIQNGQVSVGSETATVTVVCPSYTTG